MTVPPADKIYGRSVARLVALFESIERGCRVDHVKTPVRSSKSGQRWSRPAVPKHCGSIEANGSSAVPNRGGFGDGANRRPPRAAPPVQAKKTWSPAGVVHRVLEFTELTTRLVQFGPSLAAPPRDAVAKMHVNGTDYIPVVNAADSPTRVRSYRAADIDLDVNLDDKPQLIRAKRRLAAKTNKPQTNADHGPSPHAQQIGYTCDGRGLY